jgi:predicted hydrocarbon binding protein
MSDQEKTVTCISIRGAYDALSEILGDNARAIVLRGAGLARINGSPPPYTWDREFTNKQQVDIFQETIRLVGAVGAQGIIRRIGYKGVEAAVDKFGILDSIKELPPTERFTRAVEALQSALNRGTVVPGSAGLAALDVGECSLCSGVTSKKPYCSHYAGCIQMMADWVFGKGAYRVRETRCKAMGDKTCLFELEER